MEHSMQVALLVLGLLAVVVGLVGYVWMLVEAFKDEVVQGVLCLICGCYGLY
jgi:hypothetical protein